MNYATKEQLIAFEDDVKKEWEEGNLPCLLHLAGGNEDQLIEIFSRAREGDWFFASHRNHMHSLLAGIPAAIVKESIMDGRSMFSFSKERNFLSSAILAGTACIAAGVAWDIKQSGGSGHVWNFIGDGGVEEGHFHEAINFVEANQLPCTFVIEDNGIQVDSPKAVHRGPHDIMDKVFALYKCIERYEYKPRFPHAGSGCAHKIVFQQTAIDRMKANQ